MLFLIPQAVTSAAQRYPERQAVCFARQRLTYAELEAISNSLAHLLLEQGLGR